MTMKQHAASNRRLTALLLLGILAGMGSHVVQADPVFSEAFEFGAGISQRENVVAGDAFEPGPVQEGEGEWVLGWGEHWRKDTFEYVEGGGIRFLPQPRRGDGILRLPLASETEGNALEATMEFVPGTLWGWEDRSGVTGMWIGLVAGPYQQELLANNHGGFFVAARMGFNEGSITGFLELRDASGAEIQATRIENIPIQPSEKYRLILRVRPALNKTEAVLEDAFGDTIAELEGLPPEVEGFHTLQIDMTSLMFDDSAMAPVVKKVSLTAD